MKFWVLSAWMLFCLAPSQGRAESVQQAITLEADVLESVALGGLESSAFAAEGCSQDYSKRIRQLIKRSIFNPLIAVPGTAITTYTGFEIGAWIGKAVTGNSAWGSIAGSSTGLFLGFWGGTAFFAGREGVLVLKLINNLRMQRLLRADPKMLSKLQSLVADRGREMSLEELADEVRALDSSRALCNGELTGRVGDRRLRKKLVTLRGLADYLAAEKIAATQ